MGQVGLKKYKSTFLGEKTLIYTNLEKKKRKRKINQFNLD